MSFDPNSHDAVLATILARIESSDKEQREHRDLVLGKLDQVATREDVQKLDKRLTPLETIYHKAQGAWTTLALIGGVISLIAGAVGAKLSAMLTHK